LSFKPQKGLTVLTGRNAQGKTSVLEAVYLCSTGRSHRTSKDKELIKWGENFLNIASSIEKSSGDFKVEVHLTSGERKKIEINGISIARLGELMGGVNCVMFSYDDLRLIKEGPAERRKFMDIAISQVKPRYFYSLQQYIRILNQRNTLLKSINKDMSLRKTLRIWNDQIVLHASYITSERIAFTERIMKIAAGIHNCLSYEKERLRLSYTPSIPVKINDIAAIRQTYSDMLIAREDEDIKRGNTSIGCHRDDLVPDINGVDLRAFGSQGQQKTAVLSLKLAELHFMKNETEEYPILLLDDCLSEIDIYRQKKLFEISKGFQIILTVSDIRGWAAEFFHDADIYEVENADLIFK
jgi:DNA replication and repair protein RecF